MVNTLRAFNIILTLSYQISSLTYCLNQLELLEAANSFTM